MSAKPTIDVFISYSEGDLRIAEQIGEIIPGTGYRTWYYHRDYIAGQPHIETTTAIIQSAPLFVVLISRSALASDFVFPELLIAIEKKKMIVPVLVDLAWPEVIQLKPNWAAALGLNVALEWGDGDQCLVRIIKTCKDKLGQRNVTRPTPTALGEALIACISNCNPSDPADIKKRLQMAKSLLEAGADANYVDEDDKTPLSVASTIGVSRIVHMLRDKGAIR